MPPTTRDNGEEAVPLDTIFKTLSHPTRRRILTTLSEQQRHQSNPVTIDELLPADSRNERFHVSLYQNHLPQLDIVGFVNWDPDTETITPGPNYEAIHSVISLLESNQDALPADWP